VPPDVVLAEASERPATGPAAPEGGAL
jgi:hypothetical protein